MATELDLRTVGKLLGMLAHDLRNPLAALQSNLGFLETVEGLDDDSREALEDGLVSCDGLTGIIDNMELIGRSLGEAPSPVMQEFSISETIQQVESACAVMARSHGVQLAADPEGSRSTYVVRSDRDHLSLCLVNVVMNSIQLSPQDGRVTIAVEATEDSVSVVVRDDGVAPPRTARASIFTAQGQLDSKRAPTGRYSRGLGLLCARIAAARAGASVELVDPATGEGNAFRVRAPRA